MRRLARVWIVLALAVLGTCVFAAPAQAATVCSASDNSRFVAFNGTRSWTDFSSFVGCENPPTTGTFAICTAIGQQPGTGGTTIAPYRQLAGPTELSWQLYDTSHATPIVDAGVQLGAINFTTPWYGSTQIAYSALVPVSPTLINGDYTTTVLVPLELRQGSCSGAVESRFALSFTLKVGVSTYCQVTGSEPLSFGTGRTTTVHTVDANGSITVSCFWGSFAVTLSNGDHASGSQRRVSNGTDVLAYDIYTGPDRLVPWQGNTSVRATSDGVPTKVLIYGRMPGQPTPSAGVYTDTLIATVDF